MQHNVARLERQNPSTKASILSQSAQGDEDKELNARASSLEQVSEEDGQGELSQLNRDGSAYNI